MTNNARSSLLIVALFVLSPTIYGTNIIFDIHGVLLDTTVVHYLKQKNGPYNTLFKLLHQHCPLCNNGPCENYLGDSLTWATTTEAHVQREWEKGNVSCTEYNKCSEHVIDTSHLSHEAKKNIKKAINMWALPKEFIKSVTIIPEAYYIVQELDKSQDKHPLFILSNGRHEWVELYKAQFTDLMEPFRGRIVVSSEAHCKKPSKEIFQYLAKKYDVDLKESIFIDDHPKNIEAAKKLGIKAILFNPNNLDPLLKFLEAEGVLSSQGIASVKEKITGDKTN